MAPETSPFLSAGSGFKKSMNSSVGVRKMALQLDE
jgi:hypothetical protein